MHHNLTLSKTNDILKVAPAQLVVVMIHGIASDSSSYQRALEHFKNDAKLGGVRFVTFDLLGSGQSLSDDTLEYDFSEQIQALHTAIAGLHSASKIVLIGHSLGTFIVTRYASLYPDEILSLILVSPPIYTPKDLDDPIFLAGIEMFKRAVSAKNPKILEQKAFNNSMTNIVMNRDNYQTLVDTKTPTTLIFGSEDRIIASHNIPKLLRQNPNIEAISTIGGHGVTRDKYIKIAAILAKTPTTITPPDRAREDTK